MTRVEALRILGLEPNATPAEVKRAYRQLVKAVHPDKNRAPNAEQRFKRVQEAYEFISAIEDQGQTKERVAREYRDRAASEAWARAAREWAERETKQSEERESAEKEAKERADREKKAREAKEKAVKEAEVRNEWRRQRREAVTGLDGFFSGCLFFYLGVMPLFLGFIALINLGVAISRNGWWIFATIVVAFIVFSAIFGTLYYLLDERLKKYQLRKFLKNNPPPSEGTTDDIT